MSSLQKYIDYLRKEREAKEALLKSMGMNFAGLDNLKDEAIAEMQSHGSTTKGRTSENRDSHNER